MSFQECKYNLENKPKPIKTSLYNSCKCNDNGYTCLYYVFWNCKSLWQRQRRYSPRAYLIHKAEKCLTFDFRWRTYCRTRAVCICIPDSWDKEIHISLLGLNSLGCLRRIKEISFKNIASMSWLFFLQKHCLLPLCLASPSLLIGAPVPGHYSSYLGQKWKGIYRYSTSEMPRFQFSSLLLLLQGIAKGETYAWTDGVEFVPHSDLLKCQWDFAPKKGI